MSAIDFHTHAFPDGLARRAIARLQAGLEWQAVGDGTVRQLLASMDAADVDVSVVCAIATKPGQSKGIFEWCRKIASDRIVPLPSVHPDDKDIEGIVARIADEGFVGIKLHPMFQNFAADESRMDRIYAAASLHDLLVVAHCGLDIAHPPADDRADPARFRRVIDRFGNLRLVCTHMGGWRSWEKVEQYLLGTPVYLETSFSLAELGPQRAADMIRRHGVDRVVMGSDWPWNKQADEIGRINQLPLNDDEKRKILFGNGARLLLGTGTRD